MSNDSISFSTSPRLVIDRSVWQHQGRPQWVLPVSFSNSPINFGCAFANSTVQREIELKVNVATNIALTITGDPGFSATLVKRDKNPLDTSDTGSKDIPILVNAYVPPGDAVSQAAGSLVSQHIGDGIFVYEAIAPDVNALQVRFAGDLQHRLVANLDIAKQAGGANRRGVILKPMKGDAPTPSKEPEGNVAPGVNSLYVIVVSFAAPDTTRVHYNATLTVSYGGFSADIDLSVRTGKVGFTPAGEMPALFLGEVATYHYTVDNQSDDDVEIETVEETSHNSFTQPDQVFTVKANTSSAIDIQVQTSLLYFTPGVTQFTSQLVAKFGENTQLQSFANSIFCKIKPPSYTLQTKTVAGFQGSEVACTLIANNPGPVTTLQCKATNLPLGVKLMPKAFLLPSGKTTPVVLHFAIAPHADITVTGEELVVATLECATHNGVFTESFTVPFRILNPFKIQPQKNTNWCWAATTASCFRYYGGFVEQCTVVQKLKGFTSVDPCQNPTPDECNVGGQTGNALHYFGILKEDNSDSLSLPQVMAEIDAGNPVALRIKWYGEGAHAIVVSGYVVLDNNPPDAVNTMLIVNDPGNGSSVSLYSIAALTSAYSGGGGFWDRSYLTKAPPPSEQVQTSNAPLSSNEPLTN